VSGERDDDKRGPGGEGPGDAGAPTAGRSTGAPQAPQIEYPTFYTFKAMGLTGTVRDRVLQLVAQVLGEVDPKTVTVRPSSAGKYESVSVHVYLKTEDERRRIYESFHREKAIVWYC
jgi:putative lipoic acid-binding regulatory protein